MRKAMINFTINASITIMAAGLIAWAVIGIVSYGNNLRNVSSAEASHSSQVERVYENEKKTQSEDAAQEQKKDEVYTLGGTFTFYDFEITINDASEWVEYDSKLVMLFEVTYTHCGTGDPRPLNYVFITQYGPSGTVLEDVSYHIEGSYRQVGKIVPGATVTAYMPIVFDGEGIYYIEFNNLLESVMWGVIIGG